MNPFSYPGDLEDGENSGSWLRGLGSLSQKKEFQTSNGHPSKKMGHGRMGTTVSKTYLWSTLGACLVSTCVLTIHLSLMLTAREWGSTNSEQSSPCFISELVLRHWSSFFQWLRKSLPGSPQHTVFKYLKLCWLSAISWALGSVSSARGAFIFEYLSDLNL